MDNCLVEHTLLKLQLPSLSLQTTQSFDRWQNGVEISETPTNEYAFADDTNLNLITNKMEGTLRQTFLLLPTTPSSIDKNKNLDEEENDVINLIISWWKHMGSNGNIWGSPIWPRSFESTILAAQLLYTYMGLSE